MTPIGSDQPGAEGLKAIPRNGPLLKRLAVRMPTILTDLCKNSARLPMFVLARTMPGRRMHWWWAKRARPAQYAGQTLFAGVERMAVVDALRREGLFSRLMLPPGIHQDIAGFARCTPCFGNFDGRLEFMPDEHAEAEKRFGLPLFSGQYLDRILDCKAVLAVQKDPLLLDVAQHYLGGQAKLITTRVWWNFPTGKGSEPDKCLAPLGKYHFDLDDWRMLKFFFYVLPVGADTGPHVYVRASHNRRALKHQLTLVAGHPAKDVLGVYGWQSPLTLTGEAGHGFVEDPFGFHMCTAPTRTPRLMMEVGFGVSRPSRRGFHGGTAIL
ncbi:hypothetical protein [Mesorhizobium sp. WSM3224]|uniref:hypothetical protein n=1 Tax=Mesorhizobium sp. WSM3224 TaxID=1040986 RepID=UPI00040BFF12|nr:hypothetical protein [Mesorhizobium sp. WSM3224]